jgi:lysophospholipase L1-like esterase
MEKGPVVAKPLVSPVAPAKDVPFGVNEVRLNSWQWLAAMAIVALAAFMTPRLWEKIERFQTGPDYRIPYELSKDFWLYGRRVRQVADPSKIVLLGDSVVWGEYVLPNGTLSHFLNQESGTSNVFVNGGLNGLFPLAQEGLVSCYSQALQRQKLIVQCNVLWLTSPKADLSSDKEDQFNHSRLVPQFFPRIPCYRADANERLSAVIQRNVSFLAWVGHLQNAYFDQKSILTWTLEDDGGSPARYPNAWRNPLSQITLQVPLAPENDPQRGPQSPRHKAWSENGQGTTRFEWVDLGSSLQWKAFQRVLGSLRTRGNDVMVVLGPFNEHMMAEDNQAAFNKIRDGIEAWLKENQIPHVVPGTLPSQLYADASHPLTGGYQLLAKQLYATDTFRDWVKR